MIALVFLFLLMLLLKNPSLLPFANPDQSTSIALGFILIFAYLFGKQIERLGLPQITGFILAGIICGPYVLRFLDTEPVADLQLIDGLALSLIALTAGGEMRISRLKGRLKAISSLVVFQAIFIIGGFVIFGLVGFSVFPSFFGSTWTQSLAIALLLGAIATATSPSTTIAIITETKSQGQYTDLILSVAVVKDFVVIVLFAFFLSLSSLLIFPDQGFNASFLLHVMRDLGGSILLGAMVGGGIILYCKYIQKEMTIFILGIAFFTYQISYSYGFHPLLICLVGGFLVENFSRHGDRLIQAIEKSSLPVFVVFFAISGASLNLNALKTSWMLALICVVFRGMLKFVGTYAGAKLAGEDMSVKLNAWKGFISQAGVGLGLAVLVERAFPGWEGGFLSLVVAVIAINQIIGPVLLQKLLIKVGEAGTKP